MHIEGVPDAFDPADVIGHNDLTPDNLIFRDGRLVGVIDFDLAGPTTRLLDIVTTLLYWAPLRDPVDRDPVLRDADSGARMRLYATRYGLDPYAAAAAVRRRGTPAEPLMARDEARGRDQGRRLAADVGRGRR